MTDLLAQWSVVELLSCVRLFVTPWTVAYQAPLSMGFSQQKYRSGLPFTSPRTFYKNAGFTIAYSPFWNETCFTGELFEQDFNRRLA